MTSKHKSQLGRRSFFRTSGLVVAGLGLEVTIEAPQVEDFQEKHIFGVNEAIPVKSKEGWLLLIYK